MDGPKHWILSAIAVASLASSVATCSCGGGGTQAPGKNEIGPAGGTLTFDNGVQLVFPPGAVDTATVIAIEELPSAPIDAILSNPSMLGTRTKRLLGGFSAKPEGLSFKVPVEAWIPVRALEPYEIPIRLDVRRNEGTYRYGSSSLHYDGTLHRVEVELEHFSDETIGGLGPRQLDLLCTSCGTFDSAVCESFDPLQPACCMLSPSLRTPPGTPPCAAAAGCDCCREKRMIVTSVDTEISGGGCVVLGSNIQIVYPDCPDSPTETDSVEEGTCRDLTLELSITPAIMDLPVGQARTFSATATGKRGSLTVFQDVAVFPIWNSDQPVVAAFVDQLGNIRGNATNPTPIAVHATVSESSSTEASALVNVYCPGCTVEIQAARTAIAQGGSLQLGAIVRDGQGAAVSAMPTTLSWASSDPAVASLDRAMGPTTALQAHTLGDTVIALVYKDVYEQRTALQRFTVSSFAGDWDTVWGGVYTPLTIAVSETHATGSYTYGDPQCGGTVAGTIDGEISGDGVDLIGHWSEPCLDDSGSFEFHLSSDGNSFTGSWRGGAWDGVRRSPLVRNSPSPGPTPAESRGPAAPRRVQTGRGAGAGRVASF
jgi:hypothetical protein